MLEPIFICLDVSPLIPHHLLFRSAQLVPIINHLIDNAHLPLSLSFSFHISSLLYFILLFPFPLPRFPFQSIWSWVTTTSTSGCWWRWSGRSCWPRPASTLWLALISSSTMRLCQRSIFTGCCKPTRTGTPFPPCSTTSASSRRHPSSLKSLPLR